MASYTQRVVLDVDGKTARDRAEATLTTLSDLTAPPRLTSPLTVEARTEGFLTTYGLVVDIELHQRTPSQTEATVTARTQALQWYD